MDAPSDITAIERMTGSLTGMFIGDALAMPVHWYYNRRALQEDYGHITDFMAPRNPHPDSILWRSEYQAANQKGEIQPVGGLNYKIEGFYATCKTLGITNFMAHVSSLNPGSVRFHLAHGFTDCGRFLNVGVKNGRSFDMVWLQLRWGDDLFG